MTAPDRLRGAVLHAGDGCRLVRLEQGRGPTVLFVHGGLARASSWLPAVDLLRDSFRCVMLDQRGHGASDWGGGPGIDRCADDLAELLAAIGPVHAVVGHSFGALVALEAARRRPGAVARLVVYEPALSIAGPLMAEDVLAELEGAVAAGHFEEALRLHLHSPSGGATEAEIEALFSNPMIRTAYADLVAQAPSIGPVLRECNRLTSAGPYGRISADTLVLLGSASARHPFRVTAEALLETLGKARLELLEGQTHLALVTAPHLVAEATRRFLAPGT